MLIGCSVIPDLNTSTMYVRYSTKNGVKYLKCGDDNCVARASIKNGIIHVTGEHVQHDEVKVEIVRFKIAGECRKRAADQDSHTLRQIFDNVSERSYC